MFLEMLASLIAYYVVIVVLFWDVDTYPPPPWYTKIVKLFIIVGVVGGFWLLLEL